LSIQFFIIIIFYRELIRLSNKQIVLYWKKKIKIIISLYLTYYLIHINIYITYLIFNINSITISLFLKKKKNIIGLVKKFILYVIFITIYISNNTFI